ncbi:MAG: hypothetical protein OXE52_05090 [Chloroflexi bacterium]|nr:hypothetical protein [Chloroflexota bacterium]
MSQSQKSDQLKLVQRYRELVGNYESLDKRIDDLIMRHGGGTESMSEADFESYRELARLRTEVQNEMRILEQQLEIDAGPDDN